MNEYGWVYEEKNECAALALMQQLEFNYCFHRRNVSRRKRSQKSVDNQAKQRMRIYKRKQEIKKKERKHALDQESSQENQVFR